MPRFDQTIGVLMVGKVGTTRPPDHLDFREGQRVTIVLIGPARILQRFHNTRDRETLRRP
ncbi:Uncharacterised protein [Vibrio cholerae]|nr:Uncharacterised protein [Vibrio cholerae]